MAQETHNQASPYSVPPGLLGDLAQFIIDQRQELLRRRRIAGFNLRQDASDLGHRIHPYYVGEL